MGRRAASTSSARARESLEARREVGGCPRSRRSLRCSVVPTWPTAALPVASPARKRGQPGCSSAMRVEDPEQFLRGPRRPLRVVRLVAHGVEHGHHGGVPGEALDRRPFREQVGTAAAQ